MSSRLHFGALQKDGYLEINLVENSDVKAFDSMMLLKNASKIKFAEEVIRGRSQLEESEKKEDLKVIVASDLRSRSKRQIKSRTKFFDSLLSLLFSCFGYESTQKKIEVAFSLINRKEYEVIDQKEPKPESPKSPEKKEEEKVEDKKEDQPKSKEAEDQDLEKQAKKKAEQEAKQQAEKQAKEKAKQEAKEQAEKQAKEKAEQEAKEQAEKQAKEKAEQEAKEQAEKQAKEKAEQEAKEQAEKQAKLLIVNGGKKFPAADDAERLEDLQDFKESLRSVEELKKDRANIDLKFSLQAAHRQEEIKKTLNDELRKQVEEIYVSNLEAIMNHLIKGNSQAVFEIVRAFDINLQDPFLEFIAERFSSNGNYFIARAFSLSIKDEQKKMDCIARLGLLNSFEALKHCQKSEQGKRIAAFVEQKQFEMALRNLEDRAFENWILQCAITDLLEKGNLPEAHKFISLIKYEDLKQEYMKRVYARNDLFRIHHVLSGDKIDHNSMCNKELMNALDLLNEGKFSDAVEIAITLPQEVLSYFCTRLNEAYLNKGLFVEARELVRYVDHLKKQKGFIFDVSPETVYLQVSIGLLLRGDIEEGLKTVSLLSDLDKLRVVDALIDSQVNSSFPAALEILAQIENQDPRWLKLIKASLDESVCLKALQYIHLEMFKNFARLSIAVKFANIDAFLSCSNETLMTKSIETFMQAFIEKTPTIGKKEIERLEAKVEALADKELKRVLYGAIRSLHHRHPVDLEVDLRLLRKIKSLI